MKTSVFSLLAGITALGFASATQAADLIVDYAPVEPGVIDVSGNWDGAYVGVFGGWGWGEADDDEGQGGFGMADGGNDIDISGGLVGLTAGVNFTVSDSFILGVAGDIAWSGITGEIDPDLPGLSPLYEGSTHSILWQGSIRGVAGFDAGAFMPYLTAGLAVAEGERFTPIGATETVQATHVGWTAGAGVQFAVADQASIDLQYRYSDYGDATYDWAAPAATDRVVGITTHQLTVGLNWRF